VLKLPAYQYLSKQQDAVINLPLEGIHLITGPPGSELAAIARVQSWVPATGQQAGEDYNGMDVP